MAINIDFVTGYAGNSSNRCRWWSGSKRRAKGIEYGRKLMRQWGLGYGDDGLDTIPYSLVRDRNSEYYVPCEDLENIFIQASNKYDEAFEAHNDCNSFSGKCKCKKVIDKAKWEYIRNWADNARQAQSAIYGYDSCDEEEQAEAIDSVLSYAENILGDKTKGFGSVSNVQLAAMVGIGGIALSLILIRASR